MKNMIKTASAVLAAAGIVGINVAPAAMAWGDNSGSTSGRQMYTLTNCTGTGDDRSNCTVTPTMGNKVTFNSYTNGVIGDERNFVRAIAADDTSNVWKSNEITIEDGKEYIISLYAHNNNPNGVVATGTTLHYTLPTTSGASLSVQGSIDATNADPSRVYDDIVFKSSDGSAFYLDYLEGTATTKNSLGQTFGISDNIITSSGVKLGVDANSKAVNNSGNVPGCFAYNTYTYIHVKAHYVNKAYKVDKTVRNISNGEKEFVDTVDAKVGDIVEYQIYFENTGDETLNNVVVRDLLPENMEYIEGTTKVYNTNHPEGATFQDETITTTGVNIGNYEADSNAYIRFQAKVVDKSMICGSNKLVNWGQIGAGTNTIQDNAFVMVNKTEGCENTPVTPVTPVTPSTPSEMPTTGAGSIAMGVIGAGSVVTAAGYFVASRKSLRR
ncbi:DUF11 domain-containing protein [Candidatus Saccharibacteria bacterium]|nr:DUF11 domain-containing protein [Candidatus Saccharibacteria bacterium]